MSESLRRSSRRTKKHPFKEGDVVEVIKGSASVKGQLVSKIGASPSALQGRWLVSFGAKEYADEELFESSFDHAMSSSSDNEPSPTQPAPKSVVTRKARKGNGRGSKSESESESKNNKADRSPHQETTLAASDSSAHNNSNSKVRETRTARRQNRLQIGKEDHPKKKSSPTNSVGPTSGDGTGGRGNKRDGAQPPAGNPSKKFKGANNINEEVVKVPMLTGTLYLYKGIKRRAEFIRKY